MGTPREPPTQPPTWTGVRGFSRTKQPACYVVSVHGLGPQEKKKKDHDSIQATYNVGAAGNVGEMDLGRERLIVEPLEHLVGQDHARADHLS